MKLIHFSYQFEGMLHNRGYFHQFIRQANWNHLSSSGRFSYFGAGFDLHVGQLYQQVEIRNNPLNHSSKI